MCLCRAWPLRWKNTFGSSSIYLFRVAPKCSPAPIVCCSIDFSPIGILPTKKITKLRLTCKSDKEKNRYTIIKKRFDLRAKIFETLNGNFVMEQKFVCLSTMIWHVFVCSTPIFSLSKWYAWRIIYSCLCVCVAYNIRGEDKKCAK